MYEPDPLKSLLMIQQQQKLLQKNYEETLRRCLNANYSYAKIAQTLHVTEAAIRMWSKRHPER